MHDEGRVYRTAANMALSNAPIPPYKEQTITTQGKHADE